MKTPIETNARVQHEEIAELAKRLWENDSRPPGRDLDYWLRAERELLAARERPTKVTTATVKALRL